MKIYKDTGIVLYRKKFMEADKLLSIFTYQHGKIKAIAIGSRKSNAKLSTATEHVVLSSFMFLESGHQNSLTKIIGGEIITTYPELRNDFRKYLYACRVIETVDLLTVEYNKNENKYELLIRTLELIKTVQNLELLYNAFLLRFLKYCGYGFDFEKKEIYNDEEVYLSKLGKISGLEIDNFYIPEHLKEKIETRCKGLLLTYARRSLLTWNITLKDF